MPGLGGELMDIYQNDMVDIGKCHGFHYFNIIFNIINSQRRFGNPMMVQWLADTFRMHNALP